METTVELNPPKPNKSSNCRQPPEIKAKALRLLAKGHTQAEVAKQCGVGQTTVGYWATRSGLAKTDNSILNRVKHGINEQVARTVNHASREINELIAQSLSFGRSVMVKASELVPDSDHQTLVSVANAGKVGVTIARQALGLNDSTESVIVRVDLVGQAKEEKPVIELDPQP